MINHGETSRSNDALEDVTHLAFVNKTIREPDIEVFLKDFCQKSREYSGKKLLTNRTNYEL